MAFLLPVVIWPPGESITFSAKLAVLLVVLAVGFPYLLASTRRPRERSAAIALVVFLAVGLLSALLSDSRLVGIFGLYSWGTGWLFWCAVASAYAIGRSLSAAGRQGVGSALVLGAAVNGAVGILQVALQLHRAPIALYNGAQADGLLGNPIEYEAVLVGALSLACYRAVTRGRGWLAAVLFLTGALELSRERFDLVLLGGLALFVLWRFRSKLSVLTCAVVAAGYGLAWAVTGKAVRGTYSGLVDAGSNQRLLGWRAALRSIAHHLLIGVGPGESRQAIARYESLKLVQHLQVSQYFADAHDLFLEVTTTTGLLGLAALVVALVVILRASSGPLLLFALGALAVELIEPLNVAVTPLAFLALGAAGSSAAPVRLPIGRPVQPGGRLTTAKLLRGLLVAVAALASLDLLVGDAVFATASSNVSDRAAASTATRLLPIWADTAAALAWSDAYRAAVTHAVSWRKLQRQADRAAIGRDPTNPGLWDYLAATDLDLGRTSLAAEEYRKSLSLSPWGTAALSGLGTVDLVEHDCAEARKWFHLALETAPGYPPAESGLRSCAARP